MLVGEQRAEGRGASGSRYFTFESAQCAAPLPRAYQWLDATAYLSHAELLRKARGAEIPLPVDVVVAPEFNANAPATVKRVADVGVDDLILDIGPGTAKAYADRIMKVGTVVWNGPVGVFEFDAFGAGTEAVAHAIAASNAFSIAGGGDTLAAIDKYGVVDRISYISTGGGAFLEFLEGKELPAVAALRARAA